MAERDDGTDSSWRDGASTSCVDVVVPARDEERVIGRCLRALAQQDFTGEMHVFVVVNGSRDRTTSFARRWRSVFDARGDVLDVIELGSPGKAAAIRAGEHRCHGGVRVYLDADVELSTNAIAAMDEELAPKERARLVAPRLRVAPPRHFVARQVARFWVRTPSVRHRPIGAGCLAVNEAGRARWGDFPTVTADDAFVRGHFGSDEQTVASEATFTIRFPEQFSELVAVRRRWRRGTEQLRTSHADAFQPDVVIGNGRRLLGVALRDPRNLLGATALAAADLCSRLSIRRSLAEDGQWERAEHARRTIEPVPPPDPPESVEPVSVVVVTHDSADVIGDCLTSLAEAMKGLPWRVCVVDSGSRDDSVAVARRHVRSDAVIALGSNRGYSRAINIGVARLQPTGALLVLNADTRAQRGSMRRLVDALETPGVGIAAPRLVDRSGRPSASVHREPTALRAWAGALLGERLVSRLPLVGELIPAHDRAPRDAAWADGAALLVSRECRNATAAWDESFFLYSEDVDYCLRARDAGFDLRFVSEAEVVHIGGSWRTDPALWQLLVLNRVRLFDRRAGRVRRSAFRAATLTREGLRALAGRRTSAAAFAALMRDTFGSSRE